ncbi:hypothetical protein NHQ30_010931 [Ciborinia camelliae]|nr:hypothetical protein NHQ30_010931 [Ciborinia camelliae]
MFRQTGGSQQIINVAPGAVVNLPSNATMRRPNRRRRRAEARRSATSAAIDYDIEMEDVENIWNQPIEWEES